jgi:autophagy-related protein 2
LPFKCNLQRYTVDVAALRAGHLSEVLNLVPFGGVTLQLNPVSARGVQGWSSLGERVVGLFKMNAVTHRLIAPGFNPWNLYEVISWCQSLLFTFNLYRYRVVRAWLEHVSRTQAVKFATGIAPIRSVCNVGAGAAQVISQPLEFRRTGRGAWRGVTYGAAAFARAVSCEALGLGVQLAAGATSVMGGIEDLVAVDPSGGGSGGEGGLRARAAAAAAAEAGGGGGGSGSGGGPTRSFSSRHVEAGGEAMPEPAGLREGISQAAATLSRGLGSAAAAVAGLYKL